MKNGLKHILRGVLWGIVCTVLFVYVLLKISVVQEAIGSKVSAALADVLGTKVRIGRVDLRLPNRIVIDDVLLYDQARKEMLRVGRVSAAVDILDLIDGKIRIGSAQLFGMDAHLYRKDADSPLNCQFVIDSLASKDTTSHTPLDLAINSLIVRNGAVSYDQWDKPVSQGRFSPYHVGVHNISSHIILRHLTDDEIDVQVKRFAFKERSGLQVNSLKFDAKARDGDVSFDDFSLELPASHFVAPRLIAKYKLDNGTLRPGSLMLDAEINAQHISPGDFSMFLPDKLHGTLPDMTCNIKAKGTDEEIKANIMLCSLNTTDVALQASAVARHWMDKPIGTVDVTRLSVSEKMLAKANEIVKLPAEVLRLGDIDMTGKFAAYDNAHYVAKTEIKTSRVGGVMLDAELKDADVKAKVQTASLNLARILDNGQLGNIRCNLDLTASLDKGMSKLLAATVSGKVDDIVYAGHTYHNISMDGDYKSGALNGKLNVDDSRLHFATDVALTGTNIDNLMGSLNVSDFYFELPDGKNDIARLDNVSVNIGKSDDGYKDITLSSDFCHMHLHGDVTPTEIPQSFINIIATYLPSIPGFPQAKPVKSNYDLEVRIVSLDFIKKFVSLPLHLVNPLTVRGHVDGGAGDASILVQAPAFNVSDNLFTNTEVQLWTSDQSLRGNISSLYHDSEDTSVSLGIDCTAKDNDLFSVITWDNLRDEAFNGKVNTLTHFYHALGGGAGYEVSMPESFFQVGNALWSISADKIEYGKGALSIDRFLVDNDTQRLMINGVVSDSPTDTLVVNMNDIDVSYIMDLVNFHSVDFAGKASGTATASAITGDIHALANLDVAGFLFQDGRMGDMHIDATYSNETQQIDIEALADDSLAAGKTFINGYVSPQRNYIDLAIRAENTRMEFVQTFCSSFLRESDLHGDGDVRLFGPLNAINLEGQLLARGSITLGSTNCRYTMDNDTVTFIPDDIQLHSAPIKDMYGNVAYLSGGIHHENLSRLSYDLTAVTDKFLAYDFPTLGDEIFCGRAIVDGEIGIHGKGNELGIEATCTALDDSYIVYNATSPDAITSQDFITWGSVSQGNKVPEVKAATHNDVEDEDDVLNSGNDRTNIRMRFSVNATPKARLHLIMDENTGDYIDLYGQGALRANYYNKGRFELFGNYIIDHGTYKMTIQNIIRRDFDFKKGSTISFGGDPFDAVLNMQARYSLNSVSLADLSIGNSFNSNNVPVTCLMNIVGTPGKPSVTFDLDLPSLNSNARQMVYSIINSEEEMNQQVLYLLAVGRFYAQANNTAEESERVSQGTLAMQSFLSGTISQQFNTMMSQIVGKVTGNNNWSFGANIAPGNEGMSNAEYEGILSGHVLNNRLLFNGQFGYRDNVSTNTQNFIGDFNIQYLLTPNGTVSLKAYNQTNDRYFTKSSLNTQGMGVVFQKEFGK